MTKQNNKNLFEYVKSLAKTEMGEREGKREGERGEKRSKERGKEK